MPIQTTNKANVRRSDGAKIEYSTNGGSVWTDVGAIDGDINWGVNYDENNKQTNNAGKLGKTYYNMTVAGTFNWINISNSVLADLSCGLLTLSTTSGGAVATSPDQTIAEDWTDKQAYELLMETSSTDSTLLAASAEPILTSVTASVTGVLAADDDYWIQPSGNTFGGYAIAFNTAGSAGVATTESIVIDYASVPSIASSTVSMGTSIVDASDLMLRVTHTDSAGKTRVLTLKQCEIDSGAIVFDFKAPGSGEVEMMPISFTATVDSDETDGEQLLTYAVQTGAV